MKVLSFGEVLLRLAAPGYTKLFQKDGLDVSFCGAEANVAVSLSVLGVESAFLTKLPDNDVGRSAVNAMRYFGVDTSQIIFDEGRMGLYYLEKGASQRPSKVIYDRANSVMSLSKTQDYDWEHILEGVDWFHWTGITPALSQDLAAICLSACKIAKAKGIIVSCDLNYRKTLWDSHQAQKTMTELVSYVDVCIANEEDAEQVLGIKAENSNVESGYLNIDEYGLVAKKIHTIYGCKYVAITLRKSYSASTNGWSALLYNAAEDKIYNSRHYDIQIVDRVGGGDSFAAGLIYGILMRKKNSDVIEFATAASCLKQTIEGDFNRTSVDDIENLLCTGGHGRVKR